MVFSRRTFINTFIASAGTAALTACARPDANLVARATPNAPIPPTAPLPPAMPARYGAIMTEPYPIPAVPDGVVPEKFWRQEVANPFPQYEAGTITVDPDAGFLHLIEKDGRALRYGAGVGAAGFAWSGEAVMQYVNDWPRWKVPQTMADRRPDLEPYTVANGGMDPGPGNPLGARALYLFQNGKDTLYRIHGACEPEYLGKAVSSGCIRLLDQDAIDLAERVGHHARVIVFPSMNPTSTDTLY